MNPKVFEVITAARRLLDVGTAALTSRGTGRAPAKQLLAHDHFVTFIPHP